MHLEVDEIDLVMSVRRRYVNMTKRFLPQLTDLTAFTTFIQELHLIHAVEKKILLSRLPEVTETQEIADESPCHPGKFFKKQSKIAEFKRFFRQLNNETFTPDVKQALTAIYAEEPRIARIDVGYHAYRTGKENGKEVLALLTENLNLTRITFTDGNILDIPDLAEIPQLHEIFNKKMHIDTSPLPASIAL